ncbi:MAG: class I SAM-dependent methyltransferase [Chloroflexi bacterium]|nr:MAG: class I SAM-dependent methyltransferase [Chloroflexota bacterium]TMD73812.1 MAG: class I SAM-dependent methyltransferase [Chloroflexota bacterium]
MSRSHAHAHAKSFRSPQERMVGKEIEKVFDGSSDSIEVRLENFPKYVRRQHLTRLIALYELFKKVIPVKGSIVECGVNRGFGLMTWAKLSAVLEPNNLTRRIYGFDTFDGFPAISLHDRAGHGWAERGELRADSYEELERLIELYDKDRFLGHIPKVELVRGDATETIPDFMEDHPHLVVSLLFLDFDLYEPTKAAIDAFVPRMTRGAILAFDELDNPVWPGETLALLDTLGIDKLRLERLEFDPYIAFVSIP